MQKLRSSALVAVVLAIVALAAACGSSGSSSSGSGGAAASNDKALNGAGSTLVAPLIAQWAPDYATKAGVTITYGPVGSGGGIDAITSRTVDFGASDAPLSSDQATACKGCVQIPWALAATVVTYNVSGVPNKLKLTGDVLAKIFNGDITSWNDPAIKSLNPGVNLPGTHITPVYRSDGSGDSFVFTSYLSAVSPDWKSSVGASTQPSFPTGQGAEKNSGVAAAVQSTDGAIGYVAVSYIAADQLNEALVQNAAGNYPEPSTDAISAAAAAATGIQPDGSIPLVNPPASAADAYPLSTYSYAIVPKQSPKAAALKKFFTYAVTDGQSFGPDLGFPALPSSVVSHDKQVIASITS
ncbi:MAG TPA: phosphate ABC transporter substrate-binding protein PstS [Gaiellales bacterium]|nr:phosphate ABC transporter substrate-binding protein PstS [Gaiellales bacterium]